MTTCQHCGSPTRMQVQAVISAPGELNHQFSKKNLRRADVYLMGVLWETADFICTNPKCQRMVDGYGNYVTKMRKALEEIAKHPVFMKDDAPSLARQALNLPE